MRNLGLEIRNKIAKQKAVGHTKGCVVPHELMEEWAKLADALEQVNNGVKICCGCKRRGHYTKLFKDYYCDSHYDQKLNES